MKTLTDKKIKVLVTADLDVEWETNNSTIGKLGYLHNDVKEAVSNYILWCNMVDEREKYYSDEVWKRICDLKRPFKDMILAPKFIFVNDNRIIYFLNEYDLRLDVHNKEDGFEKIFGDFEK